MNYVDLRNFLNHLELRGQLRRIGHPISPDYEMTEISGRVLKERGAALLFEKPSRGCGMPVLTNLFGTVERVCMGMGVSSTSGLREIGRTLAYLKSPKPPKSLRDAVNQLPLLKTLMSMSSKILSRAVVHRVLIDDVKLSDLPIMHCWTGDVAPLITWGLTVTNNNFLRRQNLGIYRLQLIDENRLIMRWLAHRGGAIDYRFFRKNNPDADFPVSVVLGCDPAIILAAVTPIPDSMSEYQFAGLLRGNRSVLTRSTQSDLLVPANAEIVLEGVIKPNDFATEGPHGDHTGYLNEVAEFPVFTVNRITMRDNPIYHSTYTGRPPDEPAILGLALNEVFIPILQQQFEEITDFYLPAEACSYRMAIVSIRKQYPGHARRLMFGIWSFLRQFTYTKFIIVVDEDIDIRDWESVIWAISTKVDPVRDTVLIDNTPIDYLDFASPISGLGGKMGIDATDKTGNETSRPWGKEIVMSKEIKSKVDSIWSKLGI